MNLRSLMLATVLGVALTLPSAFAVDSGSFTRLPHAIQLISGSAAPGQPQVIRPQLTIAEARQPLTVVVSLRMPDPAGLGARLASGQPIAPAEMEARFLPARADYDRVVAWLASAGLTPTVADANHTNVVVRGTVAELAAAFDVSFARVATDDGEFSSAVTAPAVPSDLASAILSITGLQSHLVLRPNRLTDSPHVEAATVHPTRAVPADILAAYNAPADLDGTGQTIAIVAGDLPLATDLATFYQLSGLTKTPPPIKTVLVNGGPLVTGFSNEVTMDVSWSSALAPGAQVVLYATPSYQISDLMAACVQILNDGTAKVVSHSASTFESKVPAATLQSYSQIFAQLAAAGITVVHGDGDNGSASGVMYPASDPYVTGLSGTTVTFDASWNPAGETAWSGAGGGISTVFLRPSWQTAPGLPAGTMRCVPDAASISSTITPTNTSFPLCVVGGVTKGVGGSSLTGPVWSGLLALINQARANAGLSSIGLLGPRLYPLAGTAAFHDLVSGSNDVYQAGPGYDLCTGLGSPNVTALIAALGTTDLPAIVASPKSQTVAAGATVVFSVVATGAPAPSYQWYRDNAAISGATSAMLVLRGSDVVAGNYTCVAANTVGTATSAAATLTIANTTDVGRLTNLSILTDLSATVPSFTMGTVVAGGSAGSKSLLVRAAGPTLKAFTITDALPDPTLDVSSSIGPVGSNNDWGGSAALSAAFTQNGAFGFSDPASKDSALLLTGLPPSNYFIKVSGNNGAVGKVLAEVYDSTPHDQFTPDQPRLVNVSVLKQLGAGDTLSAGFYISGSTAKTVLIRAIGPRLGQSPFSLSGVMADPQLTVFDGNSQKIAANDNWGGDPQLTAVGPSVGAFSVTDPASKDAMLLITLAPGLYSAQATDAAQSGGLTIVEIYDVP